MASLPLGIEMLLSQQRIESDRIEFKEGWNPDAIYRSICAFANDFDNIGGGYILVGVRESNGKAERPVLGLSDDEVAKIQREMIGFNNLIRPVYHSKLAVETIDGKNLLAIWASGGSDRPYEVPESIVAKTKTYKHYIRRYANSIEARGGDRDELLSLANQVPFDDRGNRNVSIKNINLAYVQEFLRVSGSRLFDSIGTIPAEQILEHMNLFTGPEEYKAIRNVAVMLFSDAPERFFPYSYIDLVHFPRNAAERTFTEKRFSGPMQMQIRQALDYIHATVVTEKVSKISGQAEALRVWSYPYNAIEEIMVNAVYHRNYQEHEPVTVRIEPEKIMIYNCGGPDRSVKLHDLEQGTAVAGRYRNRRLGDFLKEMDLAEGRSTGMSLIHKELIQNGSPMPIIETDDERTFFRITLLIHPAFLVKGAAEVLAENIHTLTMRLRVALASNQADDQADDQAVFDGKILEVMVGVLLFCENEDRKMDEIFDAIHMKRHLDAIHRYIEPLETAGLIEKTIPDKPKSPNQRYRLTETGKSIFQEPTHA